MSNFVNKLYQNNTIIYKVILFLITTVDIVYLFPKGGQFKYDFNNGQLWKYDNLYAPFDFAVQKSEEEINIEKKQIDAQVKLYFTYDSALVDGVKEAFNRRVTSLYLTDTVLVSGKSLFNKIGLNLIDKVYKTGFLEVISEDRVSNKDELVTIRKGNVVTDVPFKNLYNSQKVLKIITENLENNFNDYKRKQIFNILSDIIKPNITFDADFTEKVIANEIKNISYTKGKVSSGALIILKGDIVEGKKLAVLSSLKSESESKVWTESNYNWIILGYTILVSLALLMLLLFLKKYRVEIYENNNKVTFIFFNVFSMIFIQTLVINYNSDYLYVVPLSILPIILKAFFDARLGLFTHVLTVLLLGYVVPNSFEFIYLHIIAGIVTILTVSELYKRANLFISVAQITGIYMLTYFAFSIIKEGNASQINLDYFILFGLNGLLSFLSIILIYIYEKVFGLVSDVTLLELSNTNTKLLRELN
jgi:membrane-associated HD superfamily phosphohydrolase